MYTQTCKHPNWNTTITKNQAHISYIGSRPGAMKLQGKESGLFGFVNGTFKNNIELSEGISYAKRESEKKHNMFRGIISFTEEQAHGLGLNKLEDWQEYVKSQIWTMAKGNNIKLENLEWEAAVHQKKGHPHVHIAFWDKNQKIIVDEVKNQVKNKIRCKMLKDTYPDLLQSFYELKKFDHDYMKEHFSETIREYELYLLQMSLSEILEFDTSSEILDIDVVSGLNKSDIENCTDSEKLLCGYLRIKEILPKKGRLAYKYLEPSVRNELNNYIKQVVKSNPKLSRLVENYVRTQLDMTENYMSNTNLNGLNRKRNQYLFKAYKELANSLLKSIKDNQMFESQSNYSSKESYDEMMSNIFYIFSNLSKLMSGCQTNNSQQYLKGDLSKEAKKEKIKENKDKGIGVEY